jgi:demethylmenaquinone methyltransferase/2-methoxy-6-polyprenyl-1,4-benzoquinol methylase
VIKIHQKRINLVKDLFSRIAGQYDRFNRLASLGQDRFWRQAAAKRVKLFDTYRVLDLASGTGDLCFAISREKSDVSVIGVDFVWPMLERTAKKLNQQTQRVSTQLLAADALKLPFPDDVFDSVTIGFGIRNMPDHLSVLKEIKRILCPGGRVIVLELRFPHERLLFKALYTIYLKIVIPILGGMLTKDKKMFHYLSESINAFPSSPDFIKTMQQAGFGLIGYKEFTFGVCVLFWGESGHKDPVSKKMPII